MSTTGALTPTSYAVLGLLAIKPYTTYELAKQMDRTLNRFWPRARSKLYEEPKKLAARGLARAADDAVGKRSRTIYTITPKGRRALRAWVAEPACPYPDRRCRSAGPPGSGAALHCQRPAAVR